jgi:hypothetical protein
MEQKADKGIKQTEKEQKQLARVFHFWNLLVTQRREKGKWK